MRFSIAIFFSFVVISMALVFGQSPFVAPAGMQQSGVLASLPSVSEARAEAPSLGPRRISDQEFPIVDSKSAVVVDAETGVILGEKEKDRVAPIASITKLMTALVFLDYNGGWDERLTISRQDTRFGGTLLVWPGEKMTYRDVFMTTLVGSQNNTAVALTRATGLPMTEFVERMNQKADVLGLTNTHFVEPTGLEPGNISSALDLVRLGNVAFQKEEIREALTMPQYVFTPLNARAARHIKTTDDLLTSTTEGYRIVGAKTGFTNDAEYTFLIQAENDSHERVLIALLGASTDATRFQDADRLIRWAFENFEW